MLSIEFPAASRVVAAQDGDEATEDEGDETFLDDHCCLFQVSFTYEYDAGMEDTDLWWGMLFGGKVVCCEGCFGVVVVVVMMIKLRGDWRSQHFLLDACALSGDGRAACRMMPARVCCCESLVGCRARRWRLVRPRSK